MIDKRYQRKPKPTHPWVGWNPGIFSKADAEKKRQPPPKTLDGTGRRRTLKPSI